MRVALFDRTDYDDLRAYGRLGELVVGTRLNHKRAAGCDVVVTTHTRPPRGVPIVVNLAPTDTRHLATVQRPTRIIQARPWNTHDVARWTLERIPMKNPKRIAVVGMGKIGTLVARYLASRGHDVVPVHRDQSHLPAGCQVVTLHARLTVENKGWADRFLPYLQGALLINSARRALVTDAALEDALRRGWVRKAHLDGGRDLDDERVEVTPHVAWRGERSRRLRPRRVVECLREAQRLLAATRV